MDSLTLLLLSGIGLVAGLGVLVGAYTWPDRALAFAYLLVLLGMTKYRERTSRAILSGSIDMQIIYELALYGAVGLIVLGAALRLRPSFRRPTMMELVLLGFVALALASITWSAVPSITLVRGVQLLLLFCLSVVAIRCIGIDGVRRALTGSVLVYVFVFAAIAAAIPAVRSGWMQHGWAGGGRFAWFDVHPITVGTLAGAGIVLLVAEAIFVPRERWLRLAGVPVIVLAPLLLAVLVAARSRGPLIATVAACTVLMFRRTFRPWLASLAAVSALVVAAALVAIAEGEALAQYVQESALSENPAVQLFLRGDTYEYLSTLGGRTKLWAEVVELFRARPLVGWGYSATRSVLLQVVPWASYAHNALAQTLLDLGVVGAALLWFAFLYSLFADFFKSSWADSPAGPARGFVFGGLSFLFVLSLVSETFAGIPGYELLLVLSCVLVSDRARVGRRPSAVAGSTAPISVGSSR